MGRFIELARPAQWIKNLAVLIGPVLGFKLFEPQAAGRAGVCFAVFCLASSASYAINDVLDREADAHHPTKCRRPVARGAIRPTAAAIFGLALFILAAGLSVGLLPRGTTILLGTYFVLILVYSIALKQRMILDVITVAVGFVLRAWAGAEAVGVLTSPWLIACTFTLCMFLGFGKRRCELAVIGNVEQAGEHRATLSRYTPELLNHLISVSAGIAIVTFLLYTMDPSQARRPPFPKEHLLYTLPLVAYGVFRYAMLAETGRWTGPTEIILKDRPFVATIVLWGLIAAGIVYEANLLRWIGFD
jgi:4-hydroxybenzoate polyprenyltransferase